MLRFRLSFALKIALAAAFLSLAGVALFAYLSFRQHAGHLTRIVSEELAATVRNAAPLFAAEKIASETPGETAALIEGLKVLAQRNQRAEQFRLFSVRNGKITPVAVSTADGAEAERIPFLPPEPILGTVEQCMRDRETCVTPLYTSGNSRWISAYAPVLNAQGELIGMLAADRRALEYERLLESETLRTLYYALAALAASMTLGVLVSIRVTRPLRKLYTAMEAARQGRFEPVEIGGTDEISELAADFNTTHETLLQKMQELETLAKELEERVRQRTDELRTSYEDARRTRDFLQHEIAIARRVQETIIPKGFTSPLISVDVEYLPILGLGGDWGVIARRGSDTLDIAVGDVTGHGIGAALVVNRVSTLLGQMCSAQANLESLIEQLDLFLAEELADIGIYMTFTACRFDLEKGRLTYVGAGHPPVIVYRPGEGIVRLESRCGLLGVGELFCDEPMTSDFDFRSGDFLAFTTDGLIEALSGSDEQFGLDRLEKTLVNSVESGCDGKRVVSCITEEVKNFTGGYLQDDVLLIVASIH